MPVSMTIRDVPDDVADELAMRAARAGQPLHEYLRSQLVALARRPGPEPLWDRVQQRAVVTGSRWSGDAILELRDADRR
ncbi:FitA-like ribbon-helix-helix domain-containing protein [Blastococcus sp. SYSU DS0973]